MSRPFNIERETIVPAEAGASEEQAFAAVSTAEGVASWLFPAGESKELVVGEEAWAGHVVRACDPPHHLKLELRDGAQLVNALDYRIERRGDGSLLIRYVHSGVFGDDWDTQFDGADHHTTFYQHTLVQYLTYFRDRHAAYVSVDGPRQSGETGSFDALRRALGFEEQPEVGVRVELDLPGIGRVEGTVDYSTREFLGIRTEDALLRFYGREFWGAGTSASHHLFAPGIDAGAEQRAWQEWIDGVFATANA